MIYLSIDLDYWLKGMNPKPFFDKVFRLRVPLQVVFEHDQLLPRINQMPEGSTLINVDEHDDLSSEPVPAGCCPDGVWVARVKWRETGHYRWLTTRKAWRCGGYDTPWKEKYRDRSKWKKLSYRKGLGDPSSYGGLRWQDVAEIGIVISPAYVRPEVVKPILDRYKITETDIDRAANMYNNSNRNKRVKRVVLRRRM